MRRAHPIAVVAALGAVVLCWILLTPPGAGADEPSHLFRAGALATGDFDEILARHDDPRAVAHVLPVEYAVPEPGCYAFQPTVGVDCALGSEARPAEPGGKVTLVTTADDYPPGGHLVPALGTALPGDGGIWAARATSGIVVVALLAASVVVAQRHRPFGAAGVLVALTPMAWATFGTVNPSSFATAGAIAMWTALLTRRPGWLLAAGWAALVLPRRDGLVWASLIVAVVVLACGCEVVDELVAQWRRLAGPLALIAATTAYMVLWSATNVSRVARLGAPAPLVIVAAWLLRRAWDRLEGRRRARAVLAAGAGAAAAVAVAATFVARPGGWYGALTWKVIRRTRAYLTQSIGVLGWLDAPLPRGAVAGWVVLVGVLVGVALRRRAWTAVTLAGGVLALAVVTAWAFELQSGNQTGTYWQGRYSLPLLVGVPLAVTLLPGGAAQPRRLGRLGLGVGAVALALVNVAAWAAARRWAVGIAGPYAPWHWGMELAPVHPLAVLAALAVASAAVLAVLAAGSLGPGAADDRADQAQRFVPPSSK